jgi:hypothetical protein
MPEGSRYTPMKDICNGGIILMKDLKPGEKEEIVEPVIGKFSFDLMFFIKDLISS